VLSLLIDLSQASGDDGRLGLVLERTEASPRLRHGRLVLLNGPVGIRSSPDHAGSPRSGLREVDPWWGPSRWRGAGDAIVDQHLLVGEVAGRRRGGDVRG
jgi:hypothetical protein